MIRFKFDVQKLNAILAEKNNSHAALMAVNERLQMARSSLGMVNAKIASDTDRFGKSTRNDYNQAALLKESIDQLQKQRESLLSHYELQGAIAARCREFAEAQGWKDLDSNSTYWHGGAL